MKFAVVALACLAVANAQFRNKAFASAFQGFGAAPVPKAAPPRPAAVARASADDRSAQILKSGSDISPDGAFNYFFETDNGIAAQAQGTPKAFGGNPPVVPDVFQGSYSWISPEGVPVSITYVADENGYQPQGDALPTPPPIPEAIARSLEYIAKNAPRQ